jgi:hypothetical protein
MSAAAPLGPRARLLRPRPPCPCHAGPALSRASPRPGGASPGARADAGRRPAGFDYQPDRRTRPHKPRTLRPAPLAPPPCRDAGARPWRRAVVRRARGRGLPPCAPPSPRCRRPGACACCSVSPPPGSHTLVSMSPVSPLSRCPVPLHAAARQASKSFRSSRSRPLRGGGGSSRAVLPQAPVGIETRWAGAVVRRLAELLGFAGTGAVARPPRGRG